MWCSIIIYIGLESNCVDKALLCIYSYKTRMPWGWCCDRQSRRSPRRFQELCCTSRTLFIDKESRWKKKDTVIWAWRSMFSCSSGKTTGQLFFCDWCANTDLIKTLTLITHEEFIMNWSSVECKRQLWTNRTNAAI